MITRKVELLDRGGYGEYPVRMVVRTFKTVRHGFLWMRKRDVEYVSTYYSRYGITWVDEDGNDVHVYFCDVLEDLMQAHKFRMAKYGEELA